MLNLKQAQWLENDAFFFELLHLNFESSHLHSSDLSQVESFKNVTRVITTLIIAVNLIKV